MAKKSRRSRNRGQRPRLTATQLVQPGVGRDAGELTAATGNIAAAEASDLSAEYTYVISDLRRIGILAAAMLALLVVLAVVLT